MEDKDEEVLIWIVLHFILVFLFCIQYSFKKIPVCFYYAVVIFLFHFFIFTHSETWYLLAYYLILSKELECYILIFVFKSSCCEKEEKLYYKYMFCISKTILLFYKFPYFSISWWILVVVMIWDLKMIVC